MREIGEEEDDLCILCSHLGNKDAGLQKCMAVTKDAEAVT